MFVSIQFSEGKFESIVRTYVENAVLTSSNLGLDGIQVFSFTPLDPESEEEPGVIDHIEIEEIDIAYFTGSNALRIPFTVLSPPGFVFLGSTPSPSQTQIEFNTPVVLCNIGAYIIRVTDLEANGLAAANASEYVKFNIQAVFQVNAPIIDDRAISLNFEPIEIKFGLGGIYVDPSEIPSAAAQRFAQRLLQVMQDNATEWFPPIRFPIGNLNTVIGDDMRVWNAGIRLNSGAIELRLQVEKASLMDFPFLGFTTYAVAWADSWSNYFSSSLINRLGALDWIVHFPFELLEKRVADTVESALARRTTVVLNQRPSSQWNVVDATTSGPCYPEAIGAIETDVAVHLPGACVPWGYDMDVNLKLYTTISIARPGVLRLDMIATHEVDPGDVFVCGSLNASLLAGGGVAIGGVFGGWIGAIVGGIAGGLLGGFTTLGIILDQDIPSIANRTLLSVEGQNNAYYTEIEIEPTTNRVLGNIAITTTFPCDDGLVAGGTLTDIDLRFEPLPNGQLSFPRWVPPRRGRCPEDGEIVIINAEVGFNFFRDSYRGIIPLYVWAFEVLEEDPSGGWPRPSIFRSSSSITVHYTMTPDQLRTLRLTTDDGIPNLKILFQTNAGARIFKLPIPSAQLTESQLDELIAEINDTCNANQDLINSFEERTRRLRDIVRGPVPFLGNITFDLTRWTFAFTGLPSNSSVSILDDNGKHLASLAPNTQNILALDFWQSDHSEANPLSLQYSGLGKQNTSFDPSFIITSQRYRIISEISINDSLTDHVTLQNKNGIFITVLTTTSLVSYQLSSSGILLETHNRNAEGIKSIHVFAGRIYAKSKSDKILVTENTRDWESLNNKSTTLSFDPKLFQQNTHCFVQADDEFLKENISSASTAKKYALLLKGNGEALLLLERLDMAAGGYLNPKTLTHQTPIPTEKDGCNPLTKIIKLFER